MTPPSDPIEDAILAAVAARGAGKSVCPSEVARDLASATASQPPMSATADPDAEGDAWRAWMPEVRRAAGRLAAAGRIAVTQKGQPVDPEDARGPIRLALPAG